MPPAVVEPPALTAKRPRVIGAEKGKGVWGGGRETRIRTENTEWENKERDR